MTRRAVENILRAAENLDLLHRADHLYGGRNFFILRIDARRLTTTVGKFVDAAVMTARKMVAVIAIVQFAVMR